MLTPQEQEIELALQMNVATLKEAFYDFVAALVLLIIAVFSLVHAVLRFVFGCLGLLLWAVALFNVFLYWCRAWAVSKSSSSLHRS